MKTLLLIALLHPCLLICAQELDPSAQLASLKRLESQLKYQKGDIDLKSGLAKLSLSEEFRYLSPTDADTELVKLWGNPPGSKTLGMIVPASQSVLDSQGWAVVITFDEDGYVKDSDADKIDYASLLKTMQEGTREANKTRKERGYPEMELVGWAAPPRYDKAARKLYWAKEISFVDQPSHTLNYNIRALGRRGVLVLNAVANMQQFGQIEKAAPEIVKMVEFNPGNRYADFDSKTDKVAAYGLAALVAGGIAAKAGLFKLLWVGLLAAKKFVVLGIIALVAFAKRLFGKRTDPTAT